MFLVKRNVEIKSFSVPNLVIENESTNDDDCHSFALREVDPNVLSAMCDEFRESVFKKAERQDPRLK